MYAELFTSIGFGLTIVFIFIGLIGTIVPLLPGMLLIWLAVLGYGIASDFSTLSIGAFVWISLIALATGTSDYWMTFLGAKKGGASRQALLFGVLGAIAGTFILPLFGTIVGYAAGLLFGEYQRHGDWDLALRAGLGGLAGWGVATAVQFIGGLIITVIFITQVLP